MKIRIANRSRHNLPEYSTKAATGMDLRANIEKDINLEPGKRALIPTGLYLEIPVGYEAQVRPRSRLAFKKGITVLKSPGTIDADYRGEVYIILKNLSEEEFVIKEGERICQIIVMKHEKAEWQRVETLDDTNKGAGGFGHTGKK